MAKNPLLEHNHYMRLYVLLIPFLWCSLASAQMATIDLSTSPPSPRPGETFTVTASSKELNLNQTKNRWVINGENIEEGVGKNKIEIFIPRGARKISLDFISTNDGSRTAGSWLINDVDLLWEPNTNNPSIFRLHPLPTTGSLVKFIADPWIYVETNVVPTSKLVYTWRKNGNELPSVSGVGRNMLSLVVGQGSPTEIISVTASTQDGKTKAERSVSINTSSPLLLLYQTDEKRGVLINHHIKDEQIFLGKGKIWGGLFNFPNDEDPIFSWFINGELATSTPKSKSFSFSLDQNSAEGKVNIVSRLNNLVTKSIDVNLKRK